MQFFKEREFCGDGVTLQGFEHTPPNAQKTVLLLHGISSRGDCFKKLMGHIDRHRVIAYDQRGHGRSDGRFNVQHAVDDLSAIIDREGVDSVMGHSLGAYISVQAAKRKEAQNDPLHRLYLIAPFIGVDMLGLRPRFGIHLTRAFTPFLDALEKGLGSLLDGFRRRMEYYNEEIIHGYAELGKCLSYRCAGLRATKLGYALPRRDEVMGTDYAPHDAYFRQRLEDLFPQAHDFSDYVMDLNHCLNAQPRDYSPLLSRIRKRNRKRLVQAIAKFLI